jgi:hypothetical protein
MVGESVAAPLNQGIGLVARIVWIRLAATGQGLPLRAGLTAL